jgi:hypothetical protein
VTRRAVALVLVALVAACEPAFAGKVDVPRGLRERGGSGGSPPTPTPAPVLGMNPLSPDSVVLTTLQNDHSMVQKARTAIGAGGVLYFLGATPRALSEGGGPPSLVSYGGHPFALNFSLFQGSRITTSGFVSSMWCDLGGLFGVFGEQCQDAQLAPLVAWLPLHATAKDWVLLGNEYTGCFASGGECEGEEADFLAFVNRFEAAVRAAVPGIKVGVAAHFDPAELDILTDLFDVTLDGYGLTVYPESILGIHDCSATGQADAIAALEAAQDFIDGLPGTVPWMVVETGLCTDPALGGSEAIQAAWAQDLLDWIATPQSTPLWVTPFILADGVVDGDPCENAARNLGAVSGGEIAAINRYVCTLGLCNTDGTPKDAAAVLATNLCPVP